MMIVMKGGEIIEEAEIFWCTCNALLIDKRNPMDDPKEYVLKFSLEGENREAAASKANKIINQLGFYHCDLSVKRIDKHTISLE